jgi:hypothetical protein
MEERITVRVFSYMEQVEETRVYLLRPQKMCKCVRQSANSYWETEEQHKQWGDPIRTEQVANFALIELEPYPNHCEFFDTREDVDQFFQAIRAKVISKVEADKTEE